MAPLSVHGSIKSAGPKSHRNRSSSPAPHYLGGSNNLLSERNRRERAETALQNTKQSLATVTEDLVPHVVQLSQAIKTIQVEKHHQLELDEMSQEVLESLQDQLNEIKERQATFPAMLDTKMEQLLLGVNEQMKTEIYEVRLMIAQMQDTLDEQVAELRLLHHEFTASQEFLTKRINAVDDAVEILRKEVNQSDELYFQSNQALGDKTGELDEKVFLLDNEVLKIKLALPSAVAAQLPIQYQTSAISNTKIEVATNTGLAVSQKLQELSQNIDTMKADAKACRAADRNQFDALTNRMREAAKRQQSLQKEIEIRLQQLQNNFDQMVTKVPSELSKRVLKLQSLWDDELRTLKTNVQKLEISHTVTGNNHVYDSIEDKRREWEELASKFHDKAVSVREIQSELRKLSSEVQFLHGGHDTTLKALTMKVTSLEYDMLGLYDWTRGKLNKIQQEITYSSEMLAYFNRHAKILPK